MFAWLDRFISGSWRDIDGTCHHGPWVTKPAIYIDPQGNQWRYRINVDDREDHTDRNNIIAPYLYHPYGDEIGDALYFKAPLSMLETLESKGYIDLRGDERISFMRKNSNLVACGYARTNVQIDSIKIFIT